MIVILVKIKHSKRSIKLGQILFTLYEEIYKKKRVKLRRK